LEEYKNSIDVKYQNENQRTALSKACDENKESIVKELLKFNPDFYEQHRPGKNDHL